MLAKIEENMKTQNILSKGLKKNYTELFLYGVMDEVSNDYIKYNLNIEDMTSNLMEKLYVEDGGLLNFVSTSFVMIEKALIFYEKDNNERMTLFMQQAVMEANLNYLEAGFAGSEDLVMTELDESVIERIVDNILMV